MHHIGVLCTIHGKLELQNCLLGEYSTKHVGHRSDSLGVWSVQDG